ncbi:glycoside hydrolase family 18 [Bacteroides heparinolyticus]|uniref:glycoside hydrolase family 18 n=1 Tax=Prevotella heparinolytica TaxID=28113 RepID=UPI0035A02E81
MKTNKNRLPVLALVMLAIGIIIGCENQNEITPINVETKAIMDQIREKDIKKWAEEKELQRLQDELDKAYNERVAKMYDKYWESLRAYKKSPHKIVYGWFGGWSATEGINKTWLSKLPDSVDVVSIWGGTSAFGEDDPRYADLKYAQEVKGLRVLLCWQTGTSGLGLPGGVFEFEKRHEGKNSTEKAKAYAQELTKFIKDHNLNGYDIDWEPNVGNHGSGCSNLYHNCEDGTNDEAPIRAFIEEMGKTFGPKATEGYNPRGTGTLFLFDGEVRDYAYRLGDTGDYFDYFLNQNYRSTTPNHEFTNEVVERIKNWSWKKYVMCDEFEMNVAEGGVCGSSGGKSCAERKAEIVKLMDFGGWGAYHIELEEIYNYRYVRSVTQIMNPCEVYIPKEVLK